MKTAKYLMIVLASCLSISAFAGNGGRDGGCGAFLSLATAGYTILADDSDVIPDSDDQGNSCGAFLQG